MSADTDRGEEPGEKGDSDVEITGTQHLDSDAVRTIRSGRKIHKGAAADTGESSSGMLSSVRKPTNSDQSLITNANSDQKKSSATQKRVARRKKTRVVSSSSEEDSLDEDFAPDVLRSLGASEAGVIGLSCLRKIECLRGKCKSLNNEEKGIMKRKIKKAIEVVNTLIFKAEATGDPDTLRQKNKSLMIQLEKYKIEEIKRNREIEEMKSTIEALRNEVSELGDKLDEIEQERVRENSRRRLEMSKERRKKEGESNEGLRTETSLVDRAGPSVVEIDSKAGDSGTQSKLTSKPGKKKERDNKIEDINKQIKALVKKRIGLRKESNVESSETGSDLQQIREKPLPQRTPRARLKIKSNVQLVPPRFGEKKGDKYRVTGQDKTVDEERKDEWTEVKRGNKGKARQSRLDSTSSAPRSKSKTGPGTEKLRTEGPNGVRSSVVTRRPPKSAAVMITGNVENFSYAEALKKARGAISLENMNIERTKVRKAANGSLLIEVMGPGGASKALELRDKLHEVLKDQAKITRPVVKGELRLVGLHDAIPPDEVVRVIASYRDCIVDDVKVGAIRPLNNGLFTAWIQCPLNAAIRMANHRKISIGWTMARVDLLSSRPTQCYRCWRFGHLRSACSFKDNFGGLCFRCGGDHMARNCNAPPACKICMSEGRAFDHRLGSNLCPVAQNQNRVRPATLAAEKSTPGSSREVAPMELDGH
ncbi:gag-pol polyprotein [Lasius niger]|uniref:Gag-pol polyprotein n=1 Tax=Lasius niger TaxID=67767 RepID=A0A0J7KCT1_LASNI|nr:gag-pol polyprotein [Lasius niger]